MQNELDCGATHVIFSGNTLLSNDQINLVINDYLQKVISFNQLQVLTFSIENQYRLSGGLARVLIPPQRILDETLYIQIEESKWGEVLIDNQYLHLNPQKVIDTISFLQIPGKLIDLKQLERSILLTGDLPGIGINASLRKSSTPLTALDPAYNKLGVGILACNKAFTPASSRLA